MAIISIRIVERMIKDDNQDTYPEQGKWHYQHHDVFITRANACQPSEQGEKAAQQIDAFLEHLIFESLALHTLYHYQSNEADFLCYFKKVGPHTTYIFLLDSPVSEDILQDYCYDINEILLTSCFAELDKMIADPTYAVSSIRKVREQIRATKEEVEQAYDKLRERGEVMEGLLEQSAKMMAYPPRFKLGYQLPLSSTQKFVNFVFSFFTYTAKPSSVTSAPMLDRPYKSV